MRALVGLFVFALSPLALAACGSSHPLDKTERAVKVAPEAIAWRVAAREDVIGYFESEHITGEAAGSLRRAFYSFASDGTYSGAALVQDAGKATFQVLSGKWKLTAGSLDLGPDSSPAKAYAAPDRLKLDSEGGSAVFRRGKAE
jgi:hypothetical protein